MPPSCASPILLSSSGLRAKEGRARRAAASQRRAQLRLQLRSRHSTRPRSTRRATGLSRRPMWLHPRSRRRCRRCRRRHQCSRRLCARRPLTCATMSAARLARPARRPRGRRCASVAKRC
eukprot:1921937-Pleurochrysis_carterae.AAC.1